MEDHHLIGEFVHRLVIVVQYLTGPNTLGLMDRAPHSILREAKSQWNERGVGLACDDITKHSVPTSIHSACSFQFLFLSRFPTAKFFCTYEM